MLTLRYDIVDTPHENKAADTEDLVVENQLSRHLWFEYPGIIGKLVTDGADWGRKDIADQECQDDLPIGHAAGLEHGPGRSQASREFGGHLQGDNPHRLRGEPGEEGKRGRHHCFHGGEDP